MKHIILLIFLLSTVVHAETIKSINIKGNVNVEAEVITSQIKVKIGDDVNDYSLNHAIKRLHATGLFADVTLKIVNGELLVEVKENPIIDSFLIKKNKSVKTSDIEKAIQVKAHSLFSEEKVQSDILEIIKLYNNNGIIDAVVRPYKVEKEDNKIDLIYEIEEGAKVKIRRINFVNNERFSDNILKSVILSREYRFYNILAGNHYYVAERTDLDASLLRNFFFSEGFLEFKINSVTTEFDGYNVNITFNVEEGEKYTVEDYTVQTSIAGLDIESLKENIVIREGDVFNINKVNNSINNIRDTLHDKGYYLAEVKPEYQTNGQLVTINYKINEGKRLQVGKVEIKGNSHTMDYVIRRELRFSEGDIYSSTDVARSKRNLMKLGFFDDVNIMPEIVGPRVNITVMVIDRVTGMANISGGISSNTGLMGSFSISDSNFLGGGDKVAFSLEKSSNNLNTAISFTRSYLWDLPISSGFDLFRENSSHQYGRSYSSSVNGVTLRASHIIRPDLQNTVKYSFKRSNIYDVDSDASILIKEQEGLTYTSLIGYALTYNNLDNVIAPKRGILARLNQDLAGIGGDLFFIRSEISATHFTTINDYDDIVIKLAVKAGYVTAYNGQEVRIGQRFFMGSNEIRGFDSSGLGPIDTKTNDFLGGKMRVFGILQADFPIGLPSDLGVKGSVFLDAGTLTGLDSITDNVIDTGNLRASVGFGFSWVSPFGLLRVDFGFPVKKDPNDKTDMIRFNMGTHF